MANQRRRTPARGLRTRRRNWQRNLFILEDVSIPTADIASNTTVFTNSAQFPVLFQFRNGWADFKPGTTDVLMFQFIRRIPSGYTPQSTITIATGSSSVTDSPDIICYAFERLQAGEVTNEPIPFNPVSPTIRLMPGDFVVLAAVPNTTSAGASAACSFEYCISALV